MRHPAPLVVAVLALAAFTPWGQESSGNRAYRRADYEAAVERYRSALSRDQTPRVQYNLGTALLRVGQLGEARERLTSALAAQLPELRGRAFYNLGNTLASGAELERGEENLRGAVEAYRRSLLLDPGNADARWNYEVALRRLRDQEERTSLPGDEPRRQSPDEASGPGLDRGQGEQGPPAQQSASEDPQNLELAGLESGAAPLPRELAEQILRAVEERERGLQRERLRQQRKRVTGPDW